MHDEACQQRVSQEQVDERLREEVRGARSLTDGAKAVGATVHLLPGSPREVGDDGAFRYVILGAAAASESGKPSPAARRVLDDTTGPGRPRVNRNAVVLAVPSRDGLVAARATVRGAAGLGGRRAAARRPPGRSVPGGASPAPAAGGARARSGDRASGVRGGRHRERTERGAGVQAARRGRSAVPCDQERRARAHSGRLRWTPKRCSRTAPTTCGARTTRPAA